MSSVAVIGAGIGGLSTAIRAAAEGRSVTLFEAAPEVGGKLRQLHLGDYRFDLGPSLFTWPDVLLEKQFVDKAVRSVVSHAQRPFLRLLWIATHAGGARLISFLNE